MTTSEYKIIFVSVRSSAHPEASSLNYKVLWMRVACNSQLHSCRVTETVNERDIQLYTAFQDLTFKYSVLDLVNVKSF